MPRNRRRNRRYVWHENTQRFTMRPSIDIDADYEPEFQEPTIKRHYVEVMCPIGSSQEAIPIIAACVICQSKQIDTINSPCMHACFCLNCANPATIIDKKCPICRVKLTEVLRMFLCFSDIDIKKAKTN